MGWLSKIFKGSNHKIKEGKYRRKSRNESSNSLPFEGNESGELDHAIAESLLEEELREANATETESNVDEDEQLARALQESLYVVSPSRQSTESPRQSTESPRQSTESSPRQSTESSPRRSTKSSPRRSTESSPRRSTESSPRRSIESSPQRSSESSPRRSTESPQRRSTESPSRRSAESPPRQSTESPPRENTKSPPWQNIELPPRQNDHIYEPTSSFFPRKPRVCAGCNNEIGYGRFLSCLGGIWHPDCFRCYGCDQPITDNEFSVYGDYPYHKSCHRDLFHPKCDVCKHFIPPNMNGLIEYRSHPFWMQQYCPSHELDGTPRCCSCERMEHRDTKYVSLDDGRKLCLECLDSAIMDTYECQPLYLDIREFFEGLNMKVDQEIPLLLVERQALNEAMEGEKQGHHRLPETRGLCLSEEQVVSTISRRPRFGSKSKVTRMITEPYQLTRLCEVTAILILYGLPRLLIGSILAHEMMHAWLRLNGYRDLSPDVEEGICQVIAHMWIESEIMSGPETNIASSSSSSSSTIPKKGTKSHSEKMLRDFFKRQIELDTSPVYGDGFRAGNEAVTKYGLRTTLDHIKLTTTFPY